MMEGVERRVERAAMEILGQDEFANEMRQCLHDRLANDPEALELLNEIPAGIWLRKAELDGRRGLKLNKG